MKRRAAIIAAAIALAVAGVAGLMLTSGDDEESASTGISSTTDASVETTPPVVATVAPTTSAPPAAPISADPPDDVAPEVATAPANETYTVCVSVVHEPPVGEPQFASHLVVDVDAGPEPRDLSIVIPGANDDQPKVIDVAVDGTILGINSFGDYRFGTVVLGGLDVTTLFATLPTITVDEETRTLFCERLDTAAPLRYVGQVNDFLSEFNIAHETGDIATLQTRLHPAARDAFTTEACELNIAQTTGSIGSIELVDVGPIEPFELATGDGVLTFPEAVEVEVNWEIDGEPVDGATFHLVLESDDVFYLSTCGQATP